VTTRDTRPRILSVVNRFPSESETFIERKARGLIANGFDVTVAAHTIGCSSESGGGAPVPMLQLPRARSPRTWGPSLRPLLTDAAARRRAAPLRHDFRQGHWLAPVVAGDYDVIHFEFSGIAASVAELLPRLRPARLAVSCRGASEQIAPHRDPDRARLLERVFTEVDLIHCVSDDMARIVIGYGAPPAKILVNRPAVDTSRWKGVGHVDHEVRGTIHAPLRALSVARLHWKKGFDDALRAVAKARSVGIHLRYQIAGEGPEREKLLFLRHSLGLDEEVSFLGWQDQQDVEQLLGTTDLFLLPSLSEGISNSALEAMAAGVPVVSTRCGGMEEALGKRDSGLLVEVGDIGQMADALASLASPGRRSALATNGAAVAQDDFDLTRQAAAFEHAYRSLLGADRGEG